MGRGVVDQGGVFAARVVVGVDGREDLGAGAVDVEEGAALELFGFQSAHERLSLSAVIGMGPGGHAWRRLVVLEPLMDGPAAILAAAVDVKDGAAASFASASRALREMAAAPAVENLAADAERFGDLLDGLATGKV